MIKNSFKLLIFLFVQSIILGCSQSDPKVHKDGVVKEKVNQSEIHVNDSINNFYSYWAGNSQDSNKSRSFNKNNEFWRKMDTNLLEPIMRWRESSLPLECQNTSFLFYPFSGPDFLIPNAIFPNIKHMVMFGLERPGRDISFKGIDFAKNSMSRMQVSLRDYCSKSYFITKNMNNDLKNDTLSGVVPLIATFLLKENFRLISIKNYKLSNNGNKIYYESSIIKKNKDTVIGVEINYTKDEKDTLRIDYLSFDAEDISLMSHNEVINFLNNQIPNETCSYLKSASYLLHYESFSKIRNILLDKSKYILQDDTGIAYEYFLKKYSWDFNLWGIYEKPIKDFSGVFQNKLDTLYKLKKQSKPLPFNMGYHYFNGNQNLMLAIKNH
jgi:hypothetical protein